MFKTSGFVLRRNDYREYDRIYTIYTSEFGKMPFLVRGAKKIKSKLAPALENFGEVKIDFARGKVFDHLTGAVAAAENKKIFEDADKIALVRDCLHLIDRFIKPEERDARIFDLINEIFRAVNIASKEQFSKIKIYFFWKLVEHLGYEPRLDECALCGAKQEIGNRNQELWLNLTDNIIICRNCTGAGILINEATLENLRQIFAMPLEEFLRTNLGAGISAITEKARQIKLSEL